MRKVEDYIGKKIHHLTILEDRGVKNGKRFVLVQCDCSRNTLKVMQFTSLFIKSPTKSCGCLKNPAKYEAADLIGKRFCRLTVIKYLGSYKGKYKAPRRHMLCRCDCGKEVEVYLNNLLNKRSPTKSCGCLDREKTGQRGRDLFSTHKLSKTPTYKCWISMKTRCYEPNDPKYHLYGGRGIKVCDRWVHSFENFYEDMGPRPEGTSLDRIDSDGDYTPDNCRYADIFVQNNNRRNTIRLTLEGVTRPLRDWARLLNVSDSTLASRYSKGWSAERILTTPVAKRATAETSTSDASD